MKDPGLVSFRMTLANRLIGDCIVGYKDCGEERLRYEDRVRDNLQQGALTLRGRLRGGTMARNKKTAPAVRLGLPADYAEFLESLKARVRHAQTKAVLSVNRELIALYWDIGQQIVERQEREGWGKSVVDRLAADIQREFPGIHGFSPRNMWRMRTFYLAYTKEVTNLPQAVPEMDGENLPQAVAQIPWGHNIGLLEKLKDPAQRLWYAAKTLEHGWSRAVLTLQIESDLYARQGKAISNFAGTLPAPFRSQDAL